MSNQERIQSIVASLRERWLLPDEAHQEFRRLAVERTVTQRFAAGRRWTAWPLENELSECALPAELKKQSPRAVVHGFDEAKRVATIAADEYYNPVADGYEGRRFSPEGELMSAELYVRLDDETELSVGYSPPNILAQTTTRSGEHWHIVIWNEQPEYEFVSEESYDVFWSGGEISLITTPGKDGPLTRFRRSETPREGLLAKYRGELVSAIEKRVDEFGKEELACVALVHGSGTTLAPPAIHFGVAEYVNDPSMSLEDRWHPLMFVEAESSKELIVSPFDDEPEHELSTIVRNVTSKGEREKVVALYRAVAQELTERWNFLPVVFSCSDDDDAPRKALKRSLTPEQWKVVSRKR
jgi:hypothetical protein